MIAKCNGTAVLISHSEQDRTIMTMRRPGRKTVVKNFGGFVDHYDHDSAAYADAWPNRRWRNESQIQSGFCAAEEHMTDLEGPSAAFR